MKNIAFRGDPGRNGRVRFNCLIVVAVRYCCRREAYDHPRDSDGLFKWASRAACGVVGEAMEYSTPPPIDEGPPGTVDMLPEIRLPIPMVW